MILKGNQRGGAKQLALHLLNTQTNDHVVIHEIRGFVSESLQSALHEAYAISRGTKCQKFLFSVSLSPPETEDVPVEEFEKAANDIEKKLGLNNQPRAIVFHEKEGRRHAHCVWSRIDTDKMRAIELPYYKNRLRDISKQLYIRNDWQMPQGFIDSEQKSPLNYTREEWQQAKRNKQDPKVLKAMFQECWAISDSQQAFSQTLQERGYYLAMGDRRGFVALDYQGKSYSLSRWIGIKPETLGEKINHPKDLLSLKAQKTEIANKLTVQIREYIQQAKIEFEKHKAVIALNKFELVHKQRVQREKLQTAQQKRLNMEIRCRSARLPKGFSGIWSRLTGKYYRIRRQNEYETGLANKRDRAERQSLIEKHLKERRQLQAKIKSTKREQIDLIKGLHTDIARYMEMIPENNSELGQKFNNTTKGVNKTRRRRARSKSSPGFEP